MYLIDTNVISERRKGRRANAGVQAFFEEAELDGQPLFLSVVTMGELRRGVELKRFRGDRQQCRLLDEWLLALQRRYAGHILGIDGRIIDLWGHLRVPHPEHALDKLIAATALIHGLTVVTRNVRDFHHTGARTLDPFSDEPPRCRILDPCMSHSGLDDTWLIHTLNPPPITLIDPTENAHVIPARPPPRQSARTPQQAHGLAAHRRRGDPHCPGYCGGTGMAVKATDTGRAVPRGRWHRSRGSLYPASAAARAWTTGSDRQPQRRGRNDWLHLRGSRGPRWLYTAGVVTTSTHAVSASVYPNLPYQPARDFAYAGFIGTSPYVLAVNRSLQSADAKALIARLRTEKGTQFSFGSVGVGTVSHLIGTQFGKLANVPLVHVPYRGAAPAYTDLIGGQVQLMFDNPVGLAPYIKAQKISAIATTAPTTLLANVPTFASQGIPHFDQQLWYGVAFPKGTAPAIVDRFNAALNKVLTDKAVVADLAAKGVTAHADTPAALQTTVLKDIPYWGAVAKSVGATIE